LEAELRDVDSRLSANAEETRNLIQTTEGQELFETALGLIETAPWLMKTIANWDSSKVSALHTKMASLVVEPSDPMNLVEGYDTPPSDALVSLAASRAGAALSYIKNATRGAISSLPLLGNQMSQHRIAVQEELDIIKIKGSSPCSRGDWQLVLRALEREKAIHQCHHDVLEPIFTREGWPEDSFFESNPEKQRIKLDMVETLERVATVKKLAKDLGVSAHIEKAIEIRNLDSRRTGISSRIQQLAEDLVACRVVAELSRTFSAEAQSALVKFAQVSGKARFGKSTQPSKMTQRQRRKRQEYLDAFEKCVRYIPCWILTSSQISDYLPSECLFDLVVIDEASQSDVTVLPGMLRGKQWLIVGDGKQVSPTESFVAEEQIEILKAALPESPLEDSMLPGHSFFDLCAQAFPKGRVSLCRQRLVCCKLPPYLL
jgi:hypothetical protein